MSLPVIRYDVADRTLTRLLDPDFRLAEIARRLHDENPEYVRAIATLADAGLIDLNDAAFIGTFCYLLLLSQLEVEELEKMVGGVNAPAALR